VCSWPAPGRNHLFLTSATRVAHQAAGDARSRSVTGRSHGWTEFAFYSAGRRYRRWRCKRCVGEAVTRRHQRVKAILIDEAGGCCAVCGYDRCVVSLHFHHVDPATKDFTVNMARGKSLAAYRGEAAKCVLVCANCHGEIEAGLIASPPPQARFREAWTPVVPTAQELIPRERVDGSQLRLQIGADEFLD
jgi:hypothetical protein